MTVSDAPSFVSHALYKYFFNLSNGKFSYSPSAITIAFSPSSKSLSAYPKASDAHSSCLSSSISKVVWNISAKGNCLLNSVTSSGRVPSITQINFKSRYLAHIPREIDFISVVLPLFAEAKTSARCPKARGVKRSAILQAISPFTPVTILSDGYILVKEL